MRRYIDRKFHIESDQIVKTSNGVPIPTDEPTMLFRAKDRLALPLLRRYRDMCAADSCVPEHLEGVDAMIADFEAFREEHPEQMKQPGVTRGV